MMQGQQDEKFEKQRPPAFLCVATEWDSGHGGISTFNRELCIALANAGSPCYCLVPELDEGQRQEAERYGVVLLAPKARVGLNSESALLGKIKLPPDLGPFWVVGHDRITGPAAAARLDESIYAGFIFVVHTIPEEIEWLKAEKDRDAARESEQRSELHLELARQAKLIVAVGPRIFARTEWLLKSEKSPPALMRLDPGLAAFNDPGSPAKKRSCLLLGRADDFNLKGLDIAAKALGRIDQHVTLVIRGAEAGKGADLKRKLDELANNPKIAIQPQEYSSDKHKISADLRRSTMVLMPSRKEGFGLVGLEAIAAGIPVLISSESGLADLLQELAPDNKVIVPVKDKTDQDAEAWSRKVDFILEDTEAAFSRARKLYEQLAQHLTWPKAVKRFLEALPVDMVEEVSCNSDIIMSPPMTIAKEEKELLGPHTSEGATISEDEMKCLKETLSRLGYLDKADRLEPLRGMLTGVAGRSRVFIVDLSRPFSNKQRFVAKFDKTRTAKELKALAKLHLSNFPNNFLVNLGDMLGLEKMPAKNGLILYKAADSVTLNHEVLSLRQYLLKYADTSQAGGTEIFSKALDSLSLLYHQAVSDKPNQTWSYYFPQVATEDKFIYESLIGKTVAGGIGKCKGQIGNQALAPIHGDLNHTNILVAMQNQAPRDVVFIDFADYREKAPIVLDFVKLETELWLETAADHPGVQGELEQRLAALITDPAAVGCNHPALKTYAQLAESIRERAIRHMGRDNFKACYGEPLVYAFLRAMTYPSIKGDKFKARLAQKGAQAAWEWFEQVPAVMNNSIPKKPVNLATESVVVGQIGELVATKLHGHFRRAFWEPFLPSLHRALGGTAEGDKLPSAVAKLLMQQDILNVPGILANTLSTAADPKNGRKAWEDGWSLMGWLVIACVDEACCQELSQHSIFRLPLKTLIGAEVVLSWQGKRQAFFKEEDRELKSQLGMDVLPESGPNAIDNVGAVADQICTLLNHKKPMVWDSDNFKKVNGMIIASKHHKPCYLAVNVEDRDHPLNQAETLASLQRHLPNLMLVYLEPTKAGQVRVLLTDEHELSGALWVYIDAKQDWLNANPDGEP